MMDMGLAFIGLALLLFGAEILIRGAVAIAKALNVTPHVIGLTVVAFGTSSPELFVSLKAALHGSPGIAIGNVIGSNIANILLMIGTVGVICPFVCVGPRLKRDGLTLLAATALLVGLFHYGMIERWHGILMLICLTGYMFYCYYDDRRQGDRDTLHSLEVDELGPVAMSTGKAALLCVGGLVGVLFGAQLLVNSAISIASEYGISETTIGLTMVAIGTSLPELATTVMAAIRKHSDVALGNIIGSNIFNTLGILGTVAIVKPLPIPPEVLGMNLWMMVGVTLVFVFAALKLHAVHRVLAGAFFFAYVAFLWAQFTPGGLAALAAS